MPYDPKGWPTPAELKFAAELLVTFQHDLEQRFPGHGPNVSIHALLSGAASLFAWLEDEDDLADILNTSLKGLARPWRLVRMTS
jgi:hypothetical protein